MHIQQSTVNQISHVDKMRIFDPGEWLRISFDVRSLVAHVRGEMFMKSKIQAGHHLMIVFVRTVSSMGDLQFAHVIDQVSVFLRVKFEYVDCVDHPCRCTLRLWYLDTPMTLVRRLGTAPFIDRLR